VRYHLVYRSSPGSGSKRRPRFFSKQVALESALNAASRLPGGDRIFVNDGAIPQPEAARMAGVGEVLTLKGVGNVQSYRTCLALVDARGWSDEDVVYFAEDDYLYTEDAFDRLVEAVGALPDVAYFTLYDHPDYYRLPLHRRFAARHSGSVQVGDVRWRAVRSTCLTYAARVQALRTDAWAHHLCARGDVPLDFAIWSIIEGGPEYLLPRLLTPAADPNIRTLLRRHAARIVRSAAWAAVDRRGSEDLPRPLGRALSRVLSRREPGRRPLFAPQPALATHMEDGMLAPGRDWASIAAASTR
jgi:hypothetical protein